MNYKRSNYGFFNRCLDVAVSGLVVATITACAANVGAGNEPEPKMVPMAPRVTVPANWRQHIDDEGCAPIVIQRRGFTWPSR